MRLYFFKKGDHATRMSNVKSPKNFEEALAVIAVLQDKIAKLEELLNLNSSNSSQPPSKDRHKKKLNTNLRGVSVAVNQVIRELQEHSCQSQKSPKL